jgi:hypothetical protein
VNQPVLEVDLRQVELVGPLERNERDREILQRETGRIEQRDVGGRFSAGRGSDEHVADLAHVLSIDEAGCNSRGKLASMTGLS